MSESSIIEKYRRLNPRFAYTFDDVECEFVKIEEGSYIEKDKLLFFPIITSITEISQAPTESYSCAREEGSWIYSSRIVDPLLEFINSPPNDCENEIYYVFCSRINFRTMDDQLIRRNIVRKSSSPTRVRLRETIFPARRDRPYSLNLNDYLIDVSDRTLAITINDDELTIEKAYSSSSDLAELMFLIEIDRALPSLGIVTFDFESLVFCYASSADEEDLIVCNEWYLEM